ncbi:MAG TPA: 50S ribosomal protein L23 [Candidatus Hydrogenedentes bacterium]|nr:50S ribosomal protein L23 [Candidatus Hydrogenedentota bacterium]HOS03306.1 50S ribosomal protein L23 [Candidatus Hydrogenedentota bacterium]
MNSDPYYIVKAPLLSEESTILSTTKNQYVFRVDPRANKGQIRDAIERIFSVKVEAVNTMNYLGKVRRRGRHEGRRPAWKKAIVTLRAGDTIELI